MAESNLPIHPIQRRDNYICQYCGKDGLASLDNWHDCVIDHLVPRTQGGQDTPENLVTSCHYCNALKRDQVFGTVAEAKSYILQRRSELESTFQRVLQGVRGRGPLAADVDDSEG